MNTTVLQIPISKALRDEAAVVASEYGFSSLQEIVRVILNKLAKRQLVVDILTERYPAVQLSTKNKKRYLKMEGDYKKGRNWRTFSTVDEFLKDLHS